MKRTELKRFTPLSPGKPLARGNGLTRSRTRRKPIVDDWSDAEAKRAPCRKCGAWSVELAHTVGKAHQNVRITSVRRWVPPDTVVPLCKSTPEGMGCHEKYDRRLISLVGCLRLSEYRNLYRTCKRVGLDWKRRVRGGRRGDV